MLELTTATVQLPRLTWNTPCRQKRKLNQWPQSSYISRPAGCPCVCFTPVYCVHHKGILSPPSWSYQSLAELRGAGKVTRTTGGSIHTADSPQRCLLRLFASSLGPLKMAWALFLWFFGLSVRVFTSEATQSRSEVVVTVSRPQWHLLFFMPIPKQEAEDRERVRQTEEGLHRMSSTSSLSPWLLMPSCRAGSLCFITVRRLS